MGRSRASSRRTASGAGPLPYEALDSSWYSRISPGWTIQSFPLMGALARPPTRAVTAASRCALAHLRGSRMTAIPSSPARRPSKRHGQPRARVLRTPSPGFRRASASRCLREGDLDEALPGELGTPRYAGPDVIARKPRVLVEQLLDRRTRRQEVVALLSS
jgi:hypothetical protein